MRGSIEHFYRRTGCTGYDDEAWSRVPQEVKDIVTGTTINDLMGWIAQAMQAGTFNARDGRPRRLRVAAGVSLGGGPAAG